jgi:DNA-binding winged helix-turn-helix (wHTH) protein/tetratricopeptide (TPR) repeat protein
MSDSLSASAEAAAIDLSREPAFDLGALSVIPSALEVRWSGHRHPVQRRVMQVLVALARRRGEVVTRDDLVASCWQGFSVSNDAIDRCVAQLRRLAELPGPPAFEIETIPRMGYRLRRDASPALGEREHRAQPAWLALAVARWRVLAGLGGVLLLAGVAWMVLARPWSDRAPPRVAVAAFAASGQGAADLAAVLSDEIGQLLSLSGSEPITTGAPNLRIGGRVDREGPLIRIRLHLDDAAGTLLWSDEFAAEASEAPTLRLEAAASAASGAAFAGLCRKIQPPIRPLCVQTGQLLRINDFYRARILAEQLTARDPGSALGQFFLGSAAAGEIELPGSVDRPARAAEAAAAARRALALDPSLTSAWRVLAQALPRRRWADRDTLLRRAVASPVMRSPLLEAGDDSGLARFLVQTGRADEAAEYAGRGANLDQLSPSRANLAAIVLEDQGRVAAARGLVDDLWRNWPHDGAAALYRRYFLLFHGSRDEARTALDAPAPFPLEPSAHDALAAFVDARFGGTPAARKAAASRILAASALLDPRLAIPALSRLGETDAALGLAGRYLQSPFADTSVLFTEPTAPLRHDRRFMALAREAGLAGYWRASGHWPDFCGARDLPYDCRREGR